MLVNRWCALGLVLLTAACAARTAPPAVVTSPRYPDFLFPTVPPDLARSAAASTHDQGWRFLQTGDLRNARRAFSAALKTAPSSYPAQAGLGYVQLAERDYREALTEFEGAVSKAPGYVPALVGKGEALLATDHAADALRSFEEALALDASLSTVRSRIDVLRLRTLQEHVAAAGQAAQAGRFDEARQAYAKAIQTSPESAFLYRDLADVERRQGDLSVALEHTRRAIELDASDVRAYELLGVVYEGLADSDAALRAYTAANELEPSTRMAEAIDRIRRHAEFLRLPAEYRAIGQSAQVTRGELAALIGVRLSSLLQSARATEAVVMTDTRGHWAANWILIVARTGVMEEFANHTFQPRGTVRRSDLASAVGRILALIAAKDPALAKRWESARPTFTDLPAGHLSYPAAAAAVAAGVLAPLDGSTFQLSRPVGGDEAVSAIERLEQLLVTKGQ